MLDQLHFLLKSHSSYLPPVSYLLSLLFLALSHIQCVEVQIYWGAQSLVATIQPEQVICSEITDTGDRDRGINRQIARCACKSERRENVGFILNVVSTWQGLSATYISQKHPSLMRLWCYIQMVPCKWFTAECTCKNMSYFSCGVITHICNSDP